MEKTPKQKPWETILTRIWRPVGFIAAVGFFIVLGLPTYGFPAHDIVGIVNVSYVLFLVGLTVAFGARSLYLGDIDSRTYAFLLGASGLLPLLAYPWFFSGLCQGLSLQYGGFAGAPPAGQGLDLAFPYPSWAIFGFSWFLDSVTFNASQLGNWLPTSIQPTAWWSNVLVWLFSVVSDALLFAVIVNILRLVGMAATGRGIERGVEQEG
jgi:hypothetical protein